MGTGKKHLLIDTFEIKGSWYLPEQDLEADAVEGILRYSPASIELELIGVFKGDGAFTESEHKTTIFGFSDKGEWITLCDCFVISASMSAPGFETQSYIANRFYAGTQLIINEGEAQFDSCAFSLTYIDAWMNIGVTERRVQTKTSRTEFIIDLAQALPQKLTLNNTKNNISICEDVQYNFEDPKDFYINESTVVKINRFYWYSHLDKSKFSFKDCMDCLNKFRNLLTLFIGIPIYLTYIDFELPSKWRPDGEESIELKQKCRIFFNQVGDISKKHKISKKRLHDMVIHRQDIIGFSDTLFDKWFNNIYELSEIVNPYVGNLYLPLYLETKFLNIIRGLETFHRFFVRQKDAKEDDQETAEMLNSEKDKLVQYIRENISEANRDHFIQRVNYEEDKNLRKRLKEIFDLLPTKLMERLFGSMNSSEKRSVVSSLIDTRNYYTHRDNKEKYPKLIDNAHKLNDIVNKLEIILQYHLFNFLGMPSDTIVSRLLEYRNNYAALR